MNPPGQVPTPAPVRIGPAEWVGQGVALFGQARLQHPSAAFERLRDAGATGPGGLEDWRRSGLDRVVLTEPLRRLVRDYRLTAAELFTVALCGEVEDRYDLNLALAELQAPQGGERPGLHLLTHLTGSLFGQSPSPAAWAQHPLVRDGVLEALGDGPWPTRQLAMDATLWRLLTTGSVHVAGCTPLEPAESAGLVPTALHEQLPGIAQMLRLRQIDHLVLRGPVATARLVAGELARLLDRRAVDVERPDAARGVALLARYGDWLSVIPLSLGPGEHYRPAEHWRSPAVFAAGADGQVHAGRALELDIPELPARERRTLWRALLPEHAERDALADTLSRAAVLPGPAIRSLAEQSGLMAAREDRAPRLGDFRAARLRHQGAALRRLAHPVARQVDPESLVLPASAERQMRQLQRRCLQREQLWHGLGPTARVSANLGVRALFSGESGTGKTLAASAVATALGAPLFRLDLASVMNKYVGETEKQLGRLLDEAAADDVILLMDEADALFGKRSGGEGQGERFANMLTNFLLTRIENHSGIVILTSNSRSRIDPAFTRRLDSIIEFPPPGVAERLRIWQLHLGGRSPGDAFCRLLASYSELSGGFIRNAVLNAAALAPDPDTPIDEATLLHSLRDEYRKLDKLFPAQLDQLRASHGADLPVEG